MANTRTGNMWYIDTASQQLTSRRIKITHIIFTPDATDDTLVLRDSSSGSNMVKIQGATAKQTQSIPFYDNPLVFENGVYVQTLTSGATATLIVKEG